MKLVFSSPDLVTVSELKDQLEAAGMACFIKNEVSAQLFGEIPRNEATPELWIDDDSRLEEALKIKADWLSPQPADAPAWTCPKCGEKLEAQFTSCWNCGTAKP